MKHLISESKQLFLLNYCCLTLLLMAIVQRMCCYQLQVKQKITVYFPAIPQQCKWQGKEKRFASLRFHNLCNPRQAINCLTRLSSIPSTAVGI